MTVAKGDCKTKWPQYSCSFLESSFESRENKSPKKSLKSGMSLALVLGSSCRKTGVGWGVASQCVPLKSESAKQVGTTCHYLMGTCSISMPLAFAAVPCLHIPIHTHAHFTHIPVSFQTSPGDFRAGHQSVLLILSFSFLFVPLVIIFFLFPLC